MNPSSS